MRTVVLTGAGISAESGVPTFRDADGLWEGHDPMAVATPEAFDHDPDLVQRFYDQRRPAPLDGAARRPAGVPGVRKGRAAAGCRLVRRGALRDGPGARGALLL